MNTITHRALCAFRNERAAASVALWAQVLANKAAGRSHVIALDKCIRAARDSHAAHAELGSDVANPCEMDGLFDADMLDMLAASLGDKAEREYEAHEAACDDASLSRFHADAFGG